MDAQVRFRRSSVPKTAVVIFVGMAAAFLLGGAGGYMARGLTSDQASLHGEASVVAQPVVSGGNNYRPQRSGLQIGDDGTGMQYTLGATPTRPGGPQS